MQNKFGKGIILCIIATMAWGGMFVVTNEIMKYMDPFYMTMFRYVPAAIVFSILFLAIEGADQLKGIKKDIPKLWMLGTLGFCGFSFLVFWGQSLNSETGGLIASVMMGLQPLIAVYVNKFLKGTKVNGKSVIMMILSLIGVVLVMTDGQISTLFDSENIIPFILIFAGANCWVIYSAGITFFEDYTPIKYTSTTNVLGACSMIVIIIILSLSGVLQMPEMSTVESLIPNFLYLIFIAGALAVLSWNNGNRILTPVNASLFMCVVPMTTFVLSAILYGFVPSAYELSGLCLIICGLIGNNIIIRRG